MCGGLRIGLVWPSKANLPVPIKDFPLFTYYLFLFFRLKREGDEREGKKREVGNLVSQQ